MLYDCHSVNGLHCRGPNSTPSAKITHIGPTDIQCIANARSISVGFLDEWAVGDYTTPAKGESVCLVSFVTCVFPQAYPRIPVHLTTSTPVVPAWPTRTQTRQTHTLPTRTLHAHSRHTSSASTSSPRPSPRSPTVPHPNPHEHKLAHIDYGQERGGRREKTKRTRRKTAREFRLIASSKGGAGIGLGPGIVSGVGAESETLSSLLLLGRRTTLRPETGEYVLLESGVGKKARSRSK